MPRKCLLSQRRFQATIPLLIMTSQENDAGYAGVLRRASLALACHPETHHFFTQGMLPALDMATGKVLLKSDANWLSAPMATAA